MRHWKGEQALLEHGAPNAVSAATKALAAEFAKFGGDYPRLLSIGAHDADDDYAQFETAVELAPGVSITAECGLTESVREYGDAPYATDDIVEWTMDGVDACMPIIDRLADTLHDVRLRARRAIGAWAGDRVPARLIEVRLAPYDAWRGSLEPGLVVVVEGLDEQLRPEPVELALADAAMLERELIDLKQELTDKYAARTALAVEGASGVIDQLALNAIAHFGDVAATLRRFDAEWRFWLPDSTCLMMCDGEITAGTSSPNPPLHLGRGQVTVAGHQLPHTALVAATGRPVTDIVQHPFLSADMIVTQADSSIEDDVPLVTLRLDMPRSYFCAASGRTWPQHDDAGDRSDAASGNVVAFRAR